MLSTQDQSTRTIPLSYIRYAVRILAPKSRVFGAAEVVIVEVKTEEERPLVAARLRAMGFGVMFWRWLPGKRWQGRVLRARELPQNKYDRLFAHR